MYRFPALLEAGQARRFPERLKPLWLEALGRREAEYRMLAAQSIALGHRLGVKGLETARADLAKALGRPNEDPAVSLAVVRALIVLDDRQSGPLLARAAQSGDTDLRSLIEPALARWDYQPMREIWLKRLAHGEPVFRGSLVLAIDALGAVGEQKAVDPLRSMVLSPVVPPPIRLAAARALGTLRTSGWEQNARELAADLSLDGIVARLEAAALLRRHSGAAAIKVLQQLAEDAEPAVIAAALERLIEIDPKLVLPVLTHLLPSPDARVQLQVVEVLCRLPTLEHLQLLGDRLDHAHPDVRVKARHCLEELGAKTDLHDQVIEQGTRALAGNSWRGQEQSALLLAFFEYKPAAARLVELLESNRPEVGVSAAWALRRLAVPSSLAGVLKYVADRYDQFHRSQAEAPRPPYVDDFQLTHLIQFLGLMRYRESVPLLMRIVPRFLDDGRFNPISPENRAAAAWALGLLGQEKPIPGLVDLVENRLDDLGAGNRFGLEDPRVRRMSAVALGQIKASMALRTLRKYWRHEANRDMVNNACGWAIEQITGQKVPAPGVVLFTPDYWFLSPFEDSSKSIQLVK
jgi:HEAT repeat protein